VIPVNSTVNALYNNPVINNFTFNIVAPAARENVEGIVTYLKTARELTGVKIDKEDVQAVRAYSQPPDEAPIQEILEDTTTKLLSQSLEITGRQPARGRSRSLEPKG